MEGFAHHWGTTWAAGSLGIIYLMAPWPKPQCRWLVAPSAFSKHWFWRSPPPPSVSLAYRCPSFQKMNLLGVTQERQKLLLQGLRLWLLSCATDKMQMHDILALRMRGIQSQTKSMCVGRRLGLQACQNQGMGENGDHLSSSHSPFLIPGPNTRPVCLQMSKNWEHGTMPHVRDVRKPKHSTTLMYLIWFMKYNFCGILC